MTGEERTVQVPASLPTREQIAEAWDRARDDSSIPRKRSGSMRPVDAFEAGFRSALDMLSQPTPTAEMCPDCSEHAFDGRKCVSCDYRVEQDESAEPPRIEGMAPGTQFTEEVRWTVTGTLSTGSTVAHSGSGEMRFADRFDPSTIRDVTPPAVTS